MWIINLTLTEHTFFLIFRIVVPHSPNVLCHSADVDTQILVAIVIRELYPIFWGV